MQDQFFTIAGPANGYFMNSGSKFHAYLYPVNAEADAVVLVQALKKEHPKARHFCTAIRLLPDASFSRSSDDGEPSGSAGKPILNQLIKHELTNVFAVVVRYFGGTKLGIPGLIEAYKTSTEAAIQQALIVQRKVFGEVKFTLPFDVYSGFVNHVMQHNYQLLHSGFDESVVMHIALQQSTLETELLSLLHKYSQLDFDTIEEYAQRLKWQIDILPQTIIQ
jgi:uncharacterized YigZ family protein